MMLPQASEISRQNSIQTPTFKLGSERISLTRNRSATSYQSNFTFGNNHSTQNLITNLNISSQENSESVKIISSTERKTQASGCQRIVPQKDEKNKNCKQNQRKQCKKWKKLIKKAILQAQSDQQNLNTTCSWPFCQ